MKRVSHPTLRMNAFMLFIFLVSLFLAGFSSPAPAGGTAAKPLADNILFDTLKLNPDQGVTVTNIYFQRFKWGEGILYNIDRADGVSLEGDVLKARYRVQSGSGNNCGGIMYLSSRGVHYQGYQNTYGEGEFSMVGDSKTLPISANSGWSNWIEVKQWGPVGLVIIEGASSGCQGTDAVVDLEVFHSSAARKNTQDSAKPVMIFGPKDGSIPHTTTATWFKAGVNISDFLAGVKFINPSVDAWDYGMAFRGRDGRWMLLSVMSDKVWMLQCGINGKYNIVDNGAVDNLNLNSGDSNYFELHASGSTGTFLINHKSVADLDLSCASGLGDVSLSSGWHVRNKEGGETRFEEFVVYKQGQAACPSGDTEDCDGDGLPQAEETWIANTFVPKYILDSAEPSFPPTFIYQVTPFASLHSGINKPGVVLTINALYDVDYAYPKILELPAMQFLWHYGDNEVVEIWLSRGTSDCKGALENVYHAYTASGICYSMEKFVLHGHSETRASFVRDPRYEFLESTSFDTSVLGTHPILYISKGKHAAYYNKGYDCEETTYQGTKFCVEGVCLSKMKEICSSIQSSEKAGHAILPRLDAGYNVGEVLNEKAGTFPLFNRMEENPLLAARFPNESVWGEEEFCGGHRYGDGEIQFLNPYERWSVPVVGWTITGDLPDCGGSNRSKWCGAGSTGYCGGY